jgi:hypothetical protein
MGHLNFNCTASRRGGAVGFSVRLVVHLLGVAEQVDCESKGLKPVSGLIGARVETRRLSSYGLNRIQLVPPHLGSFDDRHLEVLEIRRTNLGVAAQVDP